MKSHKKLTSAEIIHGYDPKRIKVIDLTDVLSKFPEIFSITPFDPECSKPFELDPSEAIVPLPVFAHRRSENFVFHSKPLIVIPRSPFSSSPMVEDPTFRGWYYIDEADISQGPFTSLEMDYWFDHGFFFNELLVKYKDDNNKYQSLIDLFGRPTYPTPRKIDRRASMNHEEELPSLNFSKSVSSIDHPPSSHHHHNGTIHRSLNRRSVEIEPSLTQSAWQSFINQKFEEPTHTNGKSSQQASEKPAESQETQNPKTQEVTKPQESVPKVETKIPMGKIEEEKEVAQTPEVKTEEAGQPKAKKHKKTSHRKRHKKSENATTQQEESQPVKEEKLENLVKMEKMDDKQPNPEKKTKKKKKNKASKELAVKESTVIEYAVKETPIEETTSSNTKVEQKPSKKTNKKPKSTIESQPIKPIEQSSHRLGQAYLDRRDRAKYITIFEPKVDSTEVKDKADLKDKVDLKDKAHDSHSKPSNTEHSKNMHEVPNSKQLHKLHAHHRNVQYYEVVEHTNKKM